MNIPFRYMPLLACVSLLYNVFFRSELYAQKIENVAKGVVFFAPDNTIAHEKMSVRNDVMGTEIFTSWGTIEQAEGTYNWNYIDSITRKYQLLGKRVALRISSASFSINDTPGYVFNKYHVRRIAGGYWDDFEKEESEYLLLCHKTKQAISGNFSIQQSVEDSGNTYKRKALIRTGEKQMLKGGVAYTVQFDYRVNKRSILYALVSQSSPDTVGSYFKEWTVEAGEHGIKSLEFVIPAGKENLGFEIGLITGDLVLDNINIIEMRTGYHSKGTLCFPNYLDENFRTQYAVFVKALAEKYNNDPAISAISVGGFGRWEEITLCDDQKPFLLLDQWKALKFDNESYINHINWCMDLYKNQFRNKKLYISAIGFPGVDNFRDEILTEWKVIDYALKNGIGIKQNGWQTKCSEWGSPATAVFYLANRYKHDPNVEIFYEEAAQIHSRNPVVSEIMGYPISLLNRAIIDGVDHYWMYSSDIQPVYINRFLHYANESAGNALITKLYCHFGAFDYTSPDGKIVNRQKNILMGLYQVKDTDSVETSYTWMDGFRVAQTNKLTNKIAMSIDDRQKYNGMYGAALTIDYLDAGTDSLKLFAFSPNGKSILAALKKADSGAWKSLSVRDKDWANAARNGGVDMPVELEIDDCNDGVETLRSMEIDFVPAREWQEQVNQQNLPQQKNIQKLDSAFTFEIPVQADFQVSGVSIKVCGISSGYTNITASVYAKYAGKFDLVQQKDFFMPGQDDWFYIPLAHVAKTNCLNLVVQTERGSAGLFLGKNGRAAYQLHQFKTDSTQVEFSGNNQDKNIQFDALKPFCGLVLKENIRHETRFSLSKTFADGHSEFVATAKADAGNRICFEPQTAGIYQLDSDQKERIGIMETINLKRLSIPNLPKRDFRGRQILTDSGKPLNWSFASSGWKETKLDSLGFRGKLALENAFLQTPEPLKIEANQEHQFHYILKNETSGMLTKVYWKTDAQEYCEKNSILIPIVSNDTEYREFTFPIGQEAGWQGTITGLKVLPVFGHNSSGKIAVHTIELRIGTDPENPFQEKLNVRELKPLQCH